MVIEGSEFFDSAPRQTANPVTKIDVVGGRRWVVRGNFIHDFAKGGGNNISYGAFLKGNSRDGLFARNLVACSWDHSGQVRLGLSFGGGGSGPPKICEGGTCTPEHQDGMMRNNIIVNCSDVGIYLNEASGTTLVNNTVLETRGIDARFQATDAEIRNNVVAGRIKDRAGGSSTRSSNLVEPQSTLDGWFPDPSAADLSTVSGGATSRLVDSGETLSLRHDYCGSLRDDGAIDIGAVEYDDGSACDTASFGHALERMSGGDTGTAGDAGMRDAAAGDTASGDDTRRADANPPASPDTAGGDTTPRQSDATPAADVSSRRDTGVRESNCSTAPMPRPAAWLLAFAIVGLARLRRRAAG